MKKTLCGVGSALVTAALILISTSSRAEYQDLIDTPSLKMESAPQSLLVDVAQAGERLVAVGERGHVVTSDDQGGTWVQADVATRAHLNAVYFVDEKQGWIVGEDAVILRTTDGGSSWQRLFDDRDADLRGPLLDLWFRNEQEGFAVGVFNKIFRTPDGGETWEDWYDHVDNLDEWHLFAIAAATDDVLYIASEKGLLFRSEDGGESFAPLQSDHDGSFQAVLARRGADGKDRLVLCGVGGVLMVSHDSGETWDRLDTGTEEVLTGAAWLADGSAVVVGHGGLVLKLDAKLQSVKAHPQEHGLPLSAVAQVDGTGQTLTLVVVGFGGVQTVELPHQAP